MWPRRSALFGLSLIMALSPVLPVRAAEDAKRLFDEALRSDLNDEGNAFLAFALFRRAAEAGLPEAEFNVAVMLDSGRGVVPDASQSAIWYARAAIHADQRAAYNLAQLYETGHGVPRNTSLAQAWFAASKLPAARDRALELNAQDPGVALSKPSLVAPSAGAVVPSKRSGIELVWTSQPQPEPVRFFVELRALDGAGSHEIFSREVALSGALTDQAEPEGDYAWRVFTIATKSSHYLPSDWVRFKVGNTRAAIAEPGQVSGSEASDVITRGRTVSGDVE